MNLTEHVTEFSLRDRARIAWEKERKEDRENKAKALEQTKAKIVDFWLKKFGVYSEQIIFLDEPVHYPVVGAIAVIEGVRFYAIEREYDFGDFDPKYRVGLATKCRACQKWVASDEGTAHSLVDLHNAFRRFFDACEDAEAEGIDLDYALPAGSHWKQHHPDTPSLADQLAELIQQIAAEGREV